jgi:hypothetical protein
MDHFSLFSQLGLGNWNCGRSLNPPPCTAGQLSCSDRSAPDYRGNLIEGHAEHVMQHERESLGRCQLVEHDQQGEAD